MLQHDRASPCEVGSPRDDTSGLSTVGLSMACQWRAGAAGEVLWLY